MMLRLALVLLAGLAATPALAHVGHGFSFTAAEGFAHPFSGLDHLAAMVAVGLWAALGGGKRVWAWPLAFVATMLAAAALARGGPSLPAVEPAIATTVLVLGLLVATAVQVPVPVGAALAATFALAHGYAHGAEAPAADFAGYAFGFAAATALLHLAGIGIGVGLAHWSSTIPARAFGAAAAVLGVALMVR